jgi:hypothetical protein
MTALLAQVAVPTDLNSALPYLIGMAILAALTRLFPDLGRLLAPPTAPATPGTPPADGSVLQRPAVQQLLQALTLAAATTPNKIDDLALTLLSRLTAEHPPEQLK